MATIEQLAQKIAAMKAEHVKDIEQAIRDEYAVELADTAEQPYTPPCDAPDGFEWAECEGYPRQGDRAWKSSLGFFTASFDWRGGKGKAHILRKLPKTWKPGDRAWVQVEVDEDVGGDGDVSVTVPRQSDLLGGSTSFYILASALRETPGGGE